MTPERWKQVEDIFQAALDLPPEERRGYIAGACAGDETLSEQVRWQNRAHFFGVAAQMMRRILVDHARGHNAEKRGSEFHKLSLDENIDVSSDERAAELIALDDALTALASIDEQKSRIVELRFFGGLSVEETAEVLGVSAPTVKRQWRMAKAWLFGQVSKQ